MPCLLCLNADLTGVGATYLERALAECQAHAGGKNQVVLLEAGEGVAQVAIAVGNLPTEPVLQLGGGRSVELEAVVASVRDVGVDAELFGERGAIVELGVKGFAENDFAGFAGYGGFCRVRCGSGDGTEEILVVVAASKNVKRG